MTRNHTLSPRASRSLRTLPWLSTLTLAALLVAPQNARAQYTFTNIAQTTGATPAGGTFTGFANPALSGGNVVCRTTYTGGTGTIGIFANTGAGGALQTIARAGTSGVGGSATPEGGTFNNLSNSVLSGSTIAFQGTYTGGTGTIGIFANTGAGGALQTIARAGTSGVGGSATPEGGRFTNFNSAVAVSGSTVAFQGLYTGGTGSQGIFANTGAGGALQTIARAGGGVGTATPEGGRFIGLSAPVISGSNVAFVGSYTGGTGNTGIFANTGSGGALQTIARGGSGTTGTATPDGGNFTSFGIPVISATTVAFQGNYTGGTGNTGIFANTGAGGALQTIARAGSGGVGGTATPAGGNFSDLTTPFISGSNVAFLGIYTGGTGTQGIFLSSGGVLSTIIKDGDSLFGSTVSGLVLGSLDLDGTSLAFRYTLANGRSGIALATLAASTSAPEPGTLALLALGGVAVLVKRRRK